MKMLVQFSKVSHVNIHKYFLRSRELPLKVVKCPIHPWACILPPTSFTQ